MPALEVSIAQLGAVLNHIEGNRGAGGDDAALAREALGAAGLLEPLERLAAGSPAGAVRLRAVVPPTEDAPALVRALLPTYPDMSGIFAALNGVAEASRAVAE